MNITDASITGSSALSAREPRRAVRAVVLRGDGRIALIYVAKAEIYTLPGGGVEQGESLEEACRREVREETGCSCVLEREIGCVTESRAEHDFAQISYYFFANADGIQGEPHLTEEEINDGTRPEWHTPEDAFRFVSRERSDYQQKYVRLRDIAVLSAVFPELAGKIRNKSQIL